MTPPIQQVLKAIASVTGHKPSRNGKEWKARCPAHDDQHPSLSISEGDEGRVLLCCHARCRVEDILSALGLKLRDLMPGDGARAASSPGAKPPCPKPAAGKPKTFPSAEAAVAELARRHGKCSDTWAYCDGHGELMGLTIRWDLPDDTKAILPVSRHGNTWRNAAMPEPRPLYRLSELLDALDADPKQLVFVVEGEKCAEALRALGLCATTSSGGSSAARFTDWTPLFGKECIILPDNDEPGERYAKDVADLLNKGASSA